MREGEEGEDLPDGARTRRISMRGGSRQPDPTAPGDGGGGRRDRTRGRGKEGVEEEEEGHPSSS
jgi:hypothetical protein